MLQVGHRFQSVGEVGQTHVGGDQGREPGQLEQGAREARQPVLKGGVGTGIFFRGSEDELGEIKEVPEGGRHATQVAPREIDPPKFSTTASKVGNEESLKAFGGETGIEREVEVH